MGILRETRVPASISHDVADKATELSKQAVAALQGVGIFCVELFQAKDGSLLINEIAPRPHNSGHYTLDVCTIPIRAAGASGLWTSIGRNKALKPCDHGQSHW